jgi:phage N-6-adenine-methyltransferase
MVIGHALFARASDEWGTPDDLYAALDAEFSFTLDAAATHDNAKCPTYYTREDDALLQSWVRTPSHRPTRPAIFLNPPYSQLRLFMAKAREEVSLGCLVVCLVPSRTDTRWWHDAVWDVTTHHPRPGVEVRFVRGRLKFGGRGSAPFPSAVIVMRPPGLENAT